MKAFLRAGRAGCCLVIVIAACGGDADSGAGLALGATCVPDDEIAAFWSGAGASNVNLETGHLACASKACLSFHFQGRVTCPYGQPDPAVNASLPEDQYCHLLRSPPDADHRVKLAVSPQCKSRPPATTVFCTCRCGGRDANATYCTCPTGMHCESEVISSGIASPEGGDYCVRDDAVYDDQSKCEPCDPAKRDCGP